MRVLEGALSDVDFFQTPLPDLLLHAQGRIQKLEAELRESEARAHEAELACLRFDEGICCLQWLCSRGMELYPAQLSELAIFGATRREPEWIEAARDELGR